MGCMEEPFERYNTGRSTIDHGKFNPNQTKLFWPLKDQGGEESRRSSFCNTIMLTFQVGPLFVICRHFLDIL